MFCNESSEGPQRAQGPSNPNRDPGHRLWERPCPHPKKRSWGPQQPACCPLQGTRHRGTDREPPIHRTGILQALQGGPHHPRQHPQGDKLTVIQWWCPPTSVYTTRPHLSPIQDPLHSLCSPTPNCSILNVACRHLVRVRPQPKDAASPRPTGQLPLPPSGSQEFLLIQYLYTSSFFPFFSYLFPSSSFSSFPSLTDTHLKDYSQLHKEHKMCIYVDTNRLYKPLQNSFASYVQYKKYQLLISGGTWAMWKLADPAVHKDQSC